MIPVSMHRRLSGISFPNCSTSTDLFGSAQSLVFGFRVIVADARKTWATPERFPDVDELIVDWPDAVSLVIR